MMKNLAQKDGRNSKYFEIQEDGVFVRSNFAKEINEYKIYFGDINDDETVFRKKKDPILPIIVISMVLNSILLTIVINESYQFSYSLGMIIFGIAIIPTLVVTAICSNEFRRENSKSLAASKPLTFSYTKKEMNEVNIFISNIKKGKKDYFMKQYYKVDNILPTQVQIARIHWLYEMKYINESDTKFILEEIESKRIIGGY